MVNIFFNHIGLSYHRWDFIKDLHCIFFPTSQSLPQIHPSKTPLHHQHLKFQEGQTIWSVLSATVFNVNDFAREFNGCDSRHGICLSRLSSSFNWRLTSQVVLLLFAIATFCAPITAVPCSFRQPPGRFCRCVKVFDRILTFLISRVNLIAVIAKCL